MDVSRLSFAPTELFQEKLGVEIGSATIFSVLLDKNSEIRVVFDKDVLMEDWYGCSDGTTTSYLKIKTTDILSIFLNSMKCEPLIIQV